MRGGVKYLTKHLDFGDLVELGEGGDCREIPELTDEDLPHGRLPNNQRTYQQSSKCIDDTGKRSSVNWTH